MKIWRLSQATKLKIWLQSHSPRFLSGISAPTEMAAAAFHPTHSSAPAKHGFQLKKHRSTILLSPLHSSSTGSRSGGTRIKAFFNPLEDPIIKEAIKEPVAFMGGVFAGLLRLDLNEEPLRDWIARTAEAAGTKVEELTADPDVDENSPQEIQIE